MGNDGKGLAVFLLCALFCGGIGMVIGAVNEKTGETKFEWITKGAEQP